MPTLDSPRTRHHHRRALQYPTNPLPYEQHADEHRPELCLGYEDFHASPQLLDVVHDAFDGWEVRANEPFHGSYVPLKHHVAMTRACTYGDARDSARHVLGPEADVDERPVLIDVSALPP